MSQFIEKVANSNKMFKEKQLKKWEQKWKTQQSKLVEIKPNCKKWATSSRKSRKEEIMLCRLRIGHCLFTHTYLLKNLEAPTFEKCNNISQSVRHILLECPQFKKTRQRLKIKGTMKDILQDNEDRITALFQFLKEIKYYHMI